jgi:Flp pilus assembly protein TadD
MDRLCTRYARWATATRRRAPLTLVTGLLLAGCAGIPAPEPVPSELFRDSAFAPAAEHIDADDVFALSAPMKRFIAAELHKPMHTTQLALSPQNLFDALQRRDLLKVDYDASQTRNAAQAFAARKGNCLSLVLMTAAIAKELNFQVTYEIVDTEEVWSRDREIAFLSGHVNIVLGNRPVDRGAGYDPRATLVVDFLPAKEISAAHTHPITEETVVAMYMNNRAAEALVRGAVNDAYWWARGSLERAPSYLASYNTLGVIYLRHGELDAAAGVLRRVLARDESDRQALSNLAIVVERQGQEEEARALRARLAQIEPEPPFKYFLLGRQAMLRGDYRAARDCFAREVQRADYNSEFHFWLGLADLHLGKIAEARTELTLAMANSTTDSARDLYAAKLERLRAHGMN